MNLFRIVITLCLSFLTSFQAELPRLQPEKTALTGINTLAINDVTPLVEEVFIKGECANVENIELIGNIRGVGYFENGTTSLGFEEGIIIATGPINNAHGPNASTSFTGRFGTSEADPDLDRLATSVLFDNVGIEFDFIPQKEFVSFRYVFASEEYCEFVGSQFNDVFGFFVSGPGISGPFENNAINVALIPETNEFVAINNVNHLKNSDYYIKNELEEDATQCGIEFKPDFPETIEYDGFTRALTAVFQVIPCATYHIRLVVGDVGDAELDSAVFLEAQSFDIGPAVEVNFFPNASVNGNTMVEGCLDGNLVFRRTDDFSLDLDLPVNYSVTNVSNAEEGVDFTGLPDSIVIPANSTSVSIPIEAFSDNIEEDLEEVGIEIDIPCFCSGRDETLFEIVDQQPLEVLEDTLIACIGEPLGFTPNILQGNGPFTYLWDNGGVLQSLIVDEVMTVEGYDVTITDACGEQFEVNFPLEITSIANAEMTGIFDWCPGTVLDIPVNFTGTAPWQLSYSIGTEEFFVDSIVNSPFVIQLDQGLPIVLTSFADDNCNGEIQGGIEVNITGPSAQPSVDSLLCPGESNAAIQLNVQSVVPYRVRWSPAVNDENNPTDLGVGLYEYAITDENGCSIEGSVTINEPSLQSARANNCSSLNLSRNIFIPTAFSPDNDGQNDQFRIYTNPNIIATVRAFRVFDRWGNLLYTEENFPADDSSKAWDGRHKGQLMSSGVYLYTLELEDISGAIEVMSGSVTLIR